MQTSFRHWLYQTLENHPTDLFARLINFALVFLIIANVVIIVVSSEKQIDEHFHGFFVSFEVLSVTIFTIEYLLRVWVSVEKYKKGNEQPILTRLRYVLTPMAIIDLLAIVPFYLIFFGNDMLVLRTLRLVRMFKLTRYSRSMELLVTVMKQELETIISAIFILLIMIVISATGIFLVEGHIQPDEFGSIPRALWWATVTLTTVGYGDVVPITTVGRALGVVIVITGIGMAALPAGIMASGFTTEINRRRERFKTKIIGLIKDGKLSTSKMRELEAMGKELGISRSDASLMIHEARNEAKMTSEMTCPNCGSHIHIHHGPGKLKLKTKKKPKYNPKG